MKKLKVRFKMKNISQKELNKILKLHKKWLNNEIGGERADFRWTNLCKTDLRYVDLRNAILCYADLSEANLQGADLRGADLRYVDLLWANLCSANLNHTNLYGANLRGADLLEADLSEAILYKVILLDAKNIPYIPMFCPEEGSFIGWKKVNNKYIVKLEIPAEAKRSSATTRKCRCEFAKVLAIENLNGTKSDVTEIVNDNYTPTTYKINEIVYPDYFDENRWKECSYGIHFFMNRQEAVDYY